MGAPREKVLKMLKHEAEKSIPNNLKLSQFFKVVYGEEVNEQGRLKDNQFFRLTDFTTHRYPFDIDGLVSISQRSYKGRNCYFQLATTNGSDGKRESLRKITVIGLDFDKKDKPGLDHKEILSRFKKINLFYHVMVDSGNGYHVYLAIESTEDIERVNQITKALQVKLGADSDATNTTQLLRVPYTLNCKDPNNKKPVNPIYICDLDKVKRYNLQVLEKRFLTAENEYKQSKAYHSINAIENTNIPMCIKTIIEQGSLEGTRNADLKKIVVSLRQRGKVLPEINNIAKEWALKCKPIFKDRLEYQVNYNYDHVKYTSLNCASCKDKSNCKTKIESDFNFDENTITMTESQARHLKHSNRKGFKQKNGNEECIFSILKHHSDGLTRAEITEEMTYRDNKTNITTVTLCEKTLKKTIKNLKEKGFIISTDDRTPIYKLHEPKTSIELTYSISYAPTCEAIKGRISTEELRLYHYMRYLQHVDQRENPKALKGNLFQITQSDIAKGLGLTQQRISQMIDHLIAEKIISIWYRGRSRNNGFEFNIYRLNY